MAAAGVPGGESSGARNEKRDDAASWNPRKTGVHVPEDAGEIRLVLSDGLREALDSWKARRDAEWPRVPRRAAWRSVTRRMSAHLHDALARFAPRLSERESDEIDEFLLRYDLEPLRAYAKARAAAAAAALPPPPDDGGLAIVSAVYGKGRKSVDVAQALASRIVGGRLCVRADNSLGGDPLVGVVKKLTVKYVWRGRRRTRCVAEYDTLVLP